MTETLTLPADARAARADRIPVAVLGATGSVGQRLVQLLEHHPWFRLHEVVASERSAGKSYGDAADWRLDTLLPHAAAALDVKPLGAELESRLLFSGLDSSVAGDAEEHYANRGCAVVSNSKNHRMGADVPLLLPEINADHLGAIERWMFAENALLHPSTYPGHGRELADGYDAIVDYMQRMHAESMQIFRSLDDSRFDERTTTPGGAHLRVRHWIRSMIEHEIHHRGQLYLYLGILDVPTPPLYGLTEEQVKEFSPLSS